MKNNRIKRISIKVTSFTIHFTVYIMSLTALLTSSALSMHAVISLSLPNTAVIYAVPIEQPTAMLCLQ